MKPVEELFISRYSNREIKTFLKHFNAQYDDSDEGKEDFSVGQELESMLLTHGRGGFTRGINREAITKPEKRQEYLKVYQKYFNSDAPFENLKWTSFDEENQKMYFFWREAIIHILEAPMSEVPLYIHSNDECTKFIARYRLKKGK